MPKTEKLTDEVRAALEAEANGVPPELAEQHASVVKEWNTWVATQDIYFGGALAYRTGDPVPVANVEKYHYDELDMVAGRETKAAESAVAATAPSTTDGKVT